MHDFVVDAEWSAQAGARHEAELVSESIGAMGHDAGAPLVGLQPARLRRAVAALAIRIHGMIVRVGEARRAECVFVLTDAHLAAFGIFADRGQAMSRISVLSTSIGRTVRSTSDVESQSCTLG